MLRFDPSCFYIFDQRNVKNEFTAHKQVLFSLNRADFHIIQEHINSISGLISVAEQFCQDQLHSVQMDRIKINVHGSAEKGVFLVSDCDRSFLKLFDSVLNSQFSYTKIQQDNGLRNARKIIASVVEPLISALKFEQGLETILMSVKQPRTAFYLNLCYILHQKIIQRGITAVIAFDSKFDYLGSTSMHPELRGVINSIYKIRNTYFDAVHSKQIEINSRILQSNESVAYCEPTFTEEYAARKAKIEDKEMNSKLIPLVYKGSTIHRSIFSFGPTIETEMQEIIEQGEKTTTDEMLHCITIHFNEQQYDLINTQYMDNNWVFIRPHDEFQPGELKIITRELEQEVHNVVRMAGFNSNQILAQGQFIDLNNKIINVRKDMEEYALKSYRIYGTVELAKEGDENFQECFGRFEFGL
ncbi:Conserved_hypothetical protein [Hexamita inflata]|uniref:Uncharacterized protein n=1 Tax=Hexamita inflata TaxID=28002 RepID=A0AA86UGL4_9EUKA|nr:Conserved hypothetical protein [Hexamita inflata]